MPESNEVRLRTIMLTAADVLERKPTAVVVRNVAAQLRQAAGEETITQQFSALRRHMTTGHGFSEETLRGLGFIQLDSTHKSWHARQGEGET